MYPLSDHFYITSAKNILYHQQECLCQYKNTNFGILTFLCFSFQRLHFQEHAVIKRKTIKIKQISILISVKQQLRTHLSNLMMFQSNLLMDNAMFLYLFPNIFKVNWELSIPQTLWYFSKGYIHVFRSFTTLIKAMIRNSHLHVLYISHWDLKLLRQLKTFRDSSCKSCMYIYLYHGIT